MIARARHAPVRYLTFAFRIREVADPNAEDSMGCRPLTFALANDAEHLVGRCGEDLEDESEDNEVRLVHEVHTCGR